MELDLDPEMEPVAASAMRPAQFTTTHQPAVAALVFDLGGFHPTPMSKLFFPTNNDSFTRARHSKPKDLFDVAREQGWAGLWRVETRYAFHISKQTSIDVNSRYSEETTKRWDECKGELTREYKRRHREGVKRKRRGFQRGGGDEMQ